MTRRYLQVRISATVDLATPQRVAIGQLQLRRGATKEERALLAFWRRDMRRLLNDAVERPLRSRKKRRPVSYRLLNLRLREDAASHEVLAGRTVEINSVGDALRPKVRKPALDKSSDLVAGHSDKAAVHRTRGEE